MSRRLFFGIALDDSSGAAAAALVERLATFLRGTGTDARGVRWVPRDNLHLTVRFLGATTPAAFDDLQEACGHPLQSPAFRLRLDVLHALPPRGRPRVLCLAPAGDPAGARAMRRELDRRLQPLGWSVEARPFRPHLTLARCQGAGAHACRSMVRETPAPGPEGERPAVELEVRELTLFESVLSATGASYEPLARTPLGRADLPEPPADAIGTAVRPT